MERHKMTYAERQVHAKTMSAYAKEHLADGLETWKGEDDMIAMVRGDAKDYRTIARFLRTSSAERAFEKCRDLDTAARECIPESVWYALEADEEYREYTEEDEREILVYRIRNLTDEKGAIEAKLKAATQHLARLDAQ